jgi:phosphoribosylamine--glycine ligase
MNVLVIGSGGREHALVWKISQSPRVKKIFCAQGSAAIGELAETVAIASDEIDKLAEFAAKEKIDLTVVGPELPQQSCRAARRQQGFRQRDPARQQNSGRIV